MYVRDRMSVTVYIYWDELKFTFVFGSEAYINHMVNMFILCISAAHSLLSGEDQSFE